MPKETGSDAIASLIEACRASAGDMAQARVSVDAEIAKPRPVLQPAPEQPTPAEEPSPLEQRRRVMAKLAELMGERGGPYARDAAMATDMLVLEINDFVAALDYEVEVHAELGRRLKELKAQKPSPIKWVDYLRDKGVKLSRRRADEYIEIFEGKATVLEMREKKRDSMRKSRAKSPAPRGAKRTVDSARKSRPASACDIDWEQHQEDDEPDSVMRARAAEWQLIEVERIIERDFALLRPGTMPAEIKQKHWVRIRKIGKQALALADKLQRLSRREKR